MEFPEGYVPRPARIEDAEAIALMMNAHAQAYMHRDVTSGEDLGRQMQMPGIDMARDSCLVESPSGEIAGIGFAFAFEPFVQVHSIGVVALDYRGNGLGSAILDWIEDRARAAVERAAPGTRVVLDQGMDEREVDGRRLLESRGYEAVRHFWKMLIEMDEPPATPIWSEGIRLSVYDPKDDLEAAFHAGRDAFRDHWGHVDSPVEEGLQRLRHRIATDPDFDPTLRFLAWDKDEISGVCYANPKDGTDRSTGYITTVGVRRPWRRRGIALALLLHTFGEFYRRGIRRVALHVDAASLTGATRLYERAGMRVGELAHAYEKELRSGVDLSTQSVP